MCHMQQDTVDPGHVGMYIDPVVVTVVLVRPHVYQGMALEHVREGLLQLICNLHNCNSSMLSWGGASETICSRQTGRQGEGTGLKGMDFSRCQPYITVHMHHIMTAGMHRWLFYKGACDLVQ